MWIESHQELARHPKAKKLARLLDVSLPDAIGRLHLLWYFALEFAPSGDLSLIDAEEIADGAMWEGDAAQFVDALVAAGFADRDGTALVLHEWGEYGGKTVKRTAGARDRQRSHRNGAEAGNDCHADVTRDTDASHGANNNSNIGSSSSCDIPCTCASAADSAPPVETVENPEPPLFDTKLLQDARRRMEQLTPDVRESFANCIRESFSIWGRAPNGDEPLKCYMVLEWFLESEGFLETMRKFSAAGGFVNGQVPKDFSPPFRVSERETVLMAHAFHIAADADRKRIDYLRGIFKNWARLDKQELETLWRERLNSGYDCKTNHGGSG